MPAGAEVGRPAGPGSSTGSTATPRASCSWPATRRRSAASRRSFAGARSGASTRRSSAAGRRRARGGSRRRSAATGATRPGSRSTPTIRATRSRTSSSSSRCRAVAASASTLETGRTHQIRVHLAAIGHPVVGDPLYGHGAELGLERQFLHAVRARLHPPRDRRADRGLGAAAAGSRGGPRRRPEALVGYHPGGSRRPSTRWHERRAGGVSQRGTPERLRRKFTPNRSGGLRVSAVTMRELLEAGVHFGHQTRRWNPKMRRFIFGERGGIYIIDLQQTMELLQRVVSLRVEHRRAQRDRALRRHEEAVPGRRRGARPARVDAVREPPLAGRPAHELPHDPGADRRPARAAPAEDRGPARPAPAEGAPVDARRAREARGQPGRRGRHAQAARRGRRHRHEEGGARRARGAPPEHPGDRPRRHELRPRRRRLRHPRKRRRHPRRRRSSCACWPTASPRAETAASRCRTSCRRTATRRPPRAPRVAEAARARPAAEPAPDAAGGSRGCGRSAGSGARHRQPRRNRKRGAE